MSEPPVAVHALIDVESGGVLLANMLAGWLDANGESSFSVEAADEYHDHIATIGNGAAFSKGRDFAAWLGVVPEEHSTGGKQTLWKIPLRGNQYLRKLFVQGARAVMQHRAKQSSGLSAWLEQLTARTHHNIAIVALANKLARMAWAVLAKNEVYRPPLLAGAATI